MLLETCVRWSHVRRVSMCAAGDEEYACRWRVVCRVSMYAVGELENMYNW